MYILFTLIQSFLKGIVAHCVRLEHFECDTEPGFNWTIESANEAVITPPQSFQGESGSFRCQIPGVKTDETNICLWPPGIVVPFVYTLLEINALFVK